MDSFFFSFNCNKRKPVICQTTLLAPSSSASVLAARSCFFYKMRLRLRRTPGLGTKCPLELRSPSDCTMADAQPGGWRRGADGGCPPAGCVAPGLLESGWRRKQQMGRLVLCSSEEQFLLLAGGRWGATTPTGACDCAEGH